MLDGERELQKSIGQARGQSFHFRLLNPLKRILAGGPLPRNPSKCRQNLVCPPCDCECFAWDGKLDMT